MVVIDWLEGAAINNYEHHLGDYMRDAGHLSFIEDAAYRRLIDAYYIHEKPLPADVGACQKLARCTSGAERKAVAYVLSAFFELREDGHHQKRCDEVIAAFSAKQKKARDSANARWRDKRSQYERNANAMRTHSERNTNAMRSSMRTQCEGNALQSPIPNPQSGIDTSSQASHAVASPSRARVCEAPEPIGNRDPGPFERLKAAYPPGIYPQSDWLLAEREADRRAEEGETWEALIAGAERYALHCEALGRLRTQFVTKPSRFFGAELRHYREAWPLPSESTTPQPKRRKPSPTTAELEAAAAQERAHAAG